MQRPSAARTRYAAVARRSPAGRRWELAGTVAWSGLALSGREPFRRRAHRTERLSPAVGTLELGRTAAGFGYTVAVYFALTQAPSRTVAGAGRLTTPLRLAGLMAAGRGSRRLADTLLAAGSLTSILLLGSTLRANHHNDHARPAYALGNSAPSPADRT